MRVNIYYTSTFEKKFRKLPKRIKTSAIKREEFFRKDPIDPILKTHALKGRLKSFHAFSVTRHYRILFKFEKSGVVTFIDIGTHSIYR